VKRNNTSNGLYSVAVISAISENAGCIAGSINTPPTKLRRQQQQQQQQKQQQQQQQRILHDSINFNRHFKPH
jgi:transcription initiation factor TFIID subunit TAF12